VRLTLSSQSDCVRPCVFAVKAMDHFVCARSHGDTLAHPDLADVAEAVAEHVAWRFNSWCVR